MTRQQAKDALPQTMTWEEAQRLEAQGQGHIWVAYVGGYGDRGHFCVEDWITHIFHNMRQQFEAVR